MYTVLNVVLGPETEVTLICNESQIHEAVSAISNCEGSAADIIKVVETLYDCYFVSPKYVDPFNWRPADQPVEWKLTISGYDWLSQPDKDFVRGVIAEAIETFSNFEGSFSITRNGV